MIFVSVGTHPQPFPRLLNEVGRLIDEKKIKGRVTVQCGYTIFSHPKITIRDFIPIEEFEKLVREADIFITHAGEGNIGTALQSKTPMVIVPRRRNFGEHTNDHQLELAEAAEKAGYGGVVYDITNLHEQIEKSKKKKITELKGYYLPAMKKIVQEKGFIFPPEKKEKSTVPKTASIIVATLNGGEPLIRAVNGMLKQTFSGKYEIVVVDDGSFDGKTPELLKKNFAENKKVELIFLPRSGVCKARNAGIQRAKYEVVINMDHDCIPQKDWLQTMVNGFDSPRVGAVSAYGHYGGTSTGFRKELLDHLGGYDEDYFYYREDTDLSFRIMELGFEYKRVPEASSKYTEDRTLIAPKGIFNILKYTLQRFNYHMNDVLLHKKHKTKLCNEFLHVKWKFFIDPIQDFKVATGIWENENKRFSLSSPRGLTFLKNDSILHFIAIILAGIGYAFVLKWARLAGSLKHGHLLV